jgi:hypothetical protein
MAEDHRPAIALLAKAHCQFIFRVTAHSLLHYFKFKALLSASLLAFPN